MKPILAALLALVIPTGASRAQAPALDNLKPENLAAWCIVPFDAKQRSPAQRAAMLKELGIGRCAYDWRDQHIAEFEQEILEYKKHGIDYFAFWGGHEKAYALFEKYDLHPQVWRTAPSPSEGSQEEKVAAAADSMEAMAKRTAQLGCQLGLYNHGGWGGEPANLIAVCKELQKRGHQNVGIVYNWHHGHGHIDDWKAALAAMKPYLLCLNLNGMNSGAKPKILPLAQGEHDLAMLKTVADSGYDGPIGILDHQDQLDSKEALQDNLDGLDWLKKELEKPGSGGAKPQPKAGLKPALPGASINEAFGKSLTSGMLLEGKDAWRQPPITVECRVKLRDAKGYNILVASDTKASAAHWEIFSMNGSGTLTAYLPGAVPDHVQSKAVITDDRWHAVAMQYAATRVRLWADGELVADQAIELLPNRKTVPGRIGVGRLVGGNFGLRGAIDEVRIRSGIHEDLAAVSDQPFKAGSDKELAYWNFDGLGAATEGSRAPLDPLANPGWREPINRDRVYDFYAKQALHFGQMDPAAVPAILPPFPGLDGGAYGHWGNQNDQTTWKDGRVRDMHHGSMVSGVFRGGGKTLARGVSVRLSGGANAVFDEDAPRFVIAWKGALVKWSDVRRGFMHGTPAGGGEAVPVVRDGSYHKNPETYLGLYRTGEQVVFATSEGDRPRFYSASSSGGRVVETAVSAPLVGKPQWPQRIRTRLQLGAGQPYAIDTLTLPFDNPWQALFFVSGIDFLSEERLAICTIHGDVWICDVSGVELTWKRFAAGLHQPLGLKVVDGVIHVMCRDQLVALHDLNQDDEADFYQRVSGAHETSAGGHDFITGLQRDNQGRWYFASGNQGLCRVSGDGEKLEVLGTGLRNPNGIGISPDGSVVLAAVQEGNWTPASAICDASWGGHFGAGGPRAGERGYVPPMLYLPRGADNSCGGQAYIDSQRWGPVAGQWLHFSSGAASHFLVLREVIGEQSQAAAVALPGEFLSGAHRGRFSPYDGQLYVASSQGWGSYGVDDGALQRVRFTAGGSYPYPIAYETRDNGILLTFAESQPAEIAKPERWFAQQWNYRYGPAYGSPEFSVRHPDREGHDRLQIRGVYRIGDGRRVFVEIPQIQPVNQLHLHCDGTRRIELFATVHRLGKPFTDFPGYRAITKLATPTTVASDLSPAGLMNACAACHHPTQRVVGPPLAEIRQRYANNPDGIVKWAMNPENKNPQLPPMPSFKFLGEEKLRVLADLILSGDE